ncbi:MAG: PASTA domain-containing protein [Lachnospiraceae bacterium]|nr:PASTA domain-containing protein [Lachnospiraceae bacterium]
MSKGIAAAHRNHIIHRDIKPQNIIISKGGIVKVTDFGIAKAATSNTISGNVMGSLHYSSPEQARGGYSDERSDIYSLGITLFEMLTGRVPFNGDTTVTIAIKQIQEDIPALTDFVPDIPISVEQIVYKCCQKSPDRRYQNVDELLEDLKYSLQDPDGDFVHIDEPEAVGATRNAEEDLASIRKRVRQPVPERTKPKRAEKARKPDYSEDFQDGYDSRIEKLTTFFAVAAAVVIGLIVIFLVGRSFGLLDFMETSQGETRSIIEEIGKEDEQVMIDVVGMDMTAAKAALAEAHITNVQTQYADSEEAEGTVTRSAPSEGESIPTGDTVTLTVSSGPNGISLPEVLGTTREEAKTDLERAGFVVNISEESSDSVEAGRVVSQDPESGARAPSGSAVTIRVSTGAQVSKIRVPEVRGKTEMDATATLAELGITVAKVTEVYNDEYAEGLVCYQSYDVGSYLDEGASLELQVSLGPEAVTYSFKGSIQTPTQAEDPDFVPGTSITLSIVTPDRKSLLQTTTSSFPVGVNFVHITYPTATLTMTYVNMTADQTVLNESGEMVTIPGIATPKTVTRQLEFTPEEN